MWDEERLEYRQMFKVKDDAAMTFPEIGAALGITAKCARWTFYTALEKIRRRPESLKALQQVVALQQARRQEGRWLTRWE